MDSSHGEHLRAEWVERLCGELQLDADSIWAVTAWVFAARHELSGAEGELQWLALDPWRPRMVQPREPGRWRQSDPGQLAALRDKLKRTPDAVQVLVEALADPDEDMRVFWNHQLGHDLQFTCRRVLFALKEAVNDLPLAGPPSCAPWEVYVGRCLVDMWIAAGRRPSLPHGPSFRAAPLLRFARAWLRLMGAEHPEAAVREAKRTHAEWRKWLEEPSDTDSSECGD